MIQIVDYVNCASEMTVEDIAKFAYATKFGHRLVQYLPPSVFEKVSRLNTIDVTQGVAVIYYVTDTDGSLIRALSGPSQEDLAQALMDEIDRDTR